MEAIKQRLRIPEKRRFLIIYLLTGIANPKMTQDL